MIQNPTNFLGLYFYGCSNKNLAFQNIIELAQEHRRKKHKKIGFPTI